MTAQDMVRAAFDSALNGVELVRAVPVAPADGIAVVGFSTAYQAPAADLGRDDNLVSPFIIGGGDSAEEAADKFVADLSLWAEWFGRATKAYVRRAPVLESDKGFDGVTRYQVLARVSLLIPDMTDEERVICRQAALR